MQPTADFVIHNAVVRTLDSTGSVAEAVALQGDRVLAVGSQAAMLDLAGPGARRLDAEGRAVLPAFTDSHTHFKRSTIVHAYLIDFRDVRPESVADVLAAVESKAATLSPDAWIQGDGLNDTALAERRFPVRQELDAVSGDRPVVLRSVGRHVVCANTLALRFAGIDGDTVSPSGGRIDLDANGEPTGVLHEQGKLRLDMTRADTVIPRFTEEERIAALASGMRFLHTNGIAGIHEMAREADEIGDYLRLKERGRLNVRVRMYIRGIEASTRLEHLLALGLRTGLGDEWFRLGGVKFSIDGSGLARNAAVYDPYPGQPDNIGLLRIEQDELDAAVEAAHHGGLQIAVHAVGQRAVDMALHSFERIDSNGSVRARRHRIEHAYFPERPGQLKRLLGLGLVWSTQPSEIDEVGDGWSDIFGADRLVGCVPLRTGLDLGLPVLINSDYPVTSLNPFVGIAAAVTRKTANGERLDPGQAVSVDEAVRMMTNGPAYAAHSEGVAGSLEPGKFGDLVILSADPYEVAPEELGETRVTATVVGGELVYSEDLDGARPGR
jgi:predicted amidohydrolase YtcJ